MSWLLVIATAIGGAALLWQLVLQRQQLKEQQLIVAQQVRTERRDVYARFIAAMREWDAERASVINRRNRAEPGTNLDTTDLERKRSTAFELLTQVQLTGSLAVADKAAEAVSVRDLFSQQVLEARRINPDLLDAGGRRVYETAQALRDAMRADLSMDLAD